MVWGRFSASQKQENENQTNPIANRLWYNREQTFRSLNNHSTPTPSAMDTCPAEPAQLYEPSQGLRSSEMVADESRTLAEGRNRRAVQIACHQIELIGGCPPALVCHARAPRQCESSSQNHLGNCFSSFFNHMYSSNTHVLDFHTKRNS